MKKDYMPKENILYTFLYKDGKTHTFRYVGKLNSDYALMYLYLPNGQIQMTKMTFSRFKFLMQTQYQHETPLEDIEKNFKKQEEEQKRRLQEIEKKRDEEIENEINALLVFIRSINGSDAEKATAFLGETPKELAEKIDKANGLAFAELLTKVKNLIEHLKGA